MRVLLILGGETPDAGTVCYWYERSSIHLAADSGFLAYQQAGLLPDKVVGDFDSLGCDWRDLGCEAIHRPEQTATDFEKALSLVPESTETLLILGGTGGRLDHCLTNLLIAARLPEKLQVWFVDAHRVLARVTADTPFQSRTEPGTTVSLIPLLRADGVSTAGLRWNLANSGMSPQAQLGQSNVAEADAIAVRIASGMLLVYLEAGRGFCD